MARKFLYSFVLFSTLLFSCKQTETQIFEGDLEDYFWNFDYYSEAKVLVYDVNILGSKSKEYLRIEQTDSNLLLLTQFDQNFLETQMIVDSFASNGVYLVRSKFLNPETNNFVSVVFQPSLIFSFKSTHVPLGVKGMFRHQFCTNCRTKISDAWIIEDSSSMAYDSQKTHILKAKGNWRRESFRGFPEDTTIITGEMSLDYGKGFGVVRSQETHDNGQSVTRIYDRTLTVGQFNNLKNRTRFLHSL